VAIRDPSSAMKAMKSPLFLWRFIHAAWSGKMRSSPFGSVCEFSASFLNPIIS